MSYTADPNAPMRDQLTPEQIGTVIAQLFQDFGLKYDPAGVTFWTADVQSSRKTENNMREAIMASPEYKAMTDEEKLRAYVRAVRAAKGEQPDADSENYWYGFLQSNGVAEFQRKWGLPDTGEIPVAATTTTTTGGGLTTTTGGGSTTTGSGGSTTTTTTAGAVSGLSSLFSALPWWAYVVLVIIILLWLNSGSSSRR